MKNLITVSKANPCPHCGKPDWCYFVGDLSVCNRQQPPAAGWMETNTTDKDGNKFYARIDSDRKTDKPSIVHTEIYTYLDRDGQPIVRCVRQDLTNGDKKIWGEGWTGKTWTKTTKHIERSSIPIYNYALVRSAIELGGLVFFVEGEKCVEELTKLGLVVTTNFGGSKRLSPSDIEDLRGANLVICPDRDVPGIELADKVADSFPQAQWLYAFPDSQLWSRNLPPSKGADVADWIKDYPLKREQIIQAIEPRRKISLSSQTVELLGFSESDTSKREAIKDAVDKLIASKMSESERLIFLSQLSTISRWDERGVIGFYHARQKEIEQEDNREETQAEIDNILGGLNDDINLEDFVAPELLPDLLSLGKKLRYKNASVLTALLTAVSALHKVGTKICLADDYFVSSNIYSLLVSPSGQGKSPMMAALVTKPFSTIEERFLKEFELEAQNSANDAARFALMSKEEQRVYIAEYGLPKKPPTGQKILYATDLNTVAVARQFRSYPEQGFLGCYDEAKKLFDFKGGGRDNDRSDLCSLHDGGGIKELRAGEDRAIVAATNFGIYGAIQPRILLDLMGQADDSQGQWARFLYTFEAKTAKVYDLRYTENKPTSLPIKLAIFYEQILKLSRRVYTITPEGQQSLSYYLTEYTEKNRMRHSDSVLETFAGKAGGRVAKLAINLHLLRDIENHKSTIIDHETVLYAIALDEYYTNQITILYSKSMAKSGELAPKLVEIIRLAQAASVPLSARDAARNSWVFRKDKDSTDSIRGYFQQLEAMGYGKCQGVGNKMTFTAN